MTMEHSDKFVTTPAEEEEEMSGGVKNEALPFFDQLLANPVEFSLGDILPAVSDEAKTAESLQQSNTRLHDKKKHSFCNPMMGMMGGHEMAQHGVSSMTLGGGMSSGMIMYMDGFRFAMTGNQPCLNLYFPSWTLDTRWKFLAAMVFVFSLSFATEAISKYRHQLTARPVGREYQARRTRQMVISGLHGFQALLGYVVMLATMTFSVEILLSVVLGLSVGYFHYFAGEVGLEGHVTTNPCCNYMQDESNEHAQRQQQHAAAEAAAAAAALGETQESATTRLLAGGGEQQYTPECCVDTSNV